jgi:PLP dependent protein
MHRPRFELTNKARFKLEPPARTVSHELVNGIAERIEAVRAQIVTAAEKAHRAPGEIELVAVSKGHDAEKVRAAMEASQLLFGESKVQEARAKIPLLPSQLRWHFVGHLQKNKVRHALPLFELIHSVDSLELAEQIDAAALQEGVFPRVLLQINVAGEASKFGFKPDQLESTMEQLLKLRRLSIDGVMTIPPLADDPEKSRPYFVQLRSLRDDFERRLGIKLPQLSIGMSGDFTIAIEEGATLVRVGTAIFGERSRKGAL